MFKKNTTALLLSILFGVVFLISSVNAVNVDHCMNLDSANTVYTMNASIDESAGSGLLIACINITANNVTLDMNTKEIKGWATGGFTAIRVDAIDFTVKDGIFTDMETAILLQGDQTGAVNTISGIKTSGDMGGFYNDGDSSNAYSIIFKDSEIMVDVYAGTQNIGFMFQTHGEATVTNVTIHDTVNTDMTKCFQIADGASGALSSTLTNVNFNCSGGALYFGATAETSYTLNVIDSQLMNYMDGTGAPFENSVILDDTSCGHVFNMTNVSYSQKESLLTADIDCAPDLGGRVYRNWYYRAYTNYSNGTVASGANVSAFNSSNAFYFSFLTNSSGFTPKTTIMDYFSKYDSGAGDTVKFYQSNYTINATLGTYVGEISYNVTSNQNNLNSVITLLEPPTPPEITLNLPESITYFYNNNLPVNITVTNSSALSTCWFSIRNMSNYYFITNQTIANCLNTTMTLPAMVDLELVIELQANDTAGLYSDLLETVFGLNVTLPTVNLISPTNANNTIYVNGSTAMQYNTTAKTGQNISSCELWGNWTGTWHLNQTMTNVTAGTKSFNAINFSEGTYKWNVRCIDTLTNFNWYSSNFTFTVVPAPVVTPPAGGTPSGGNPSNSIIMGNDSLQNSYNGSASKGFIIEGNATSLFNISLTYDSSISMNSKHYIKVYVVSIDGELTDAENVAIVFSPEVKVIIGEIYRLNKGIYMIPVTVTSKDVSPASFSVTVSQNQKSVVSSGSFAVTEFNVQDKIRSIYNWVSDNFIIIFLVFFGIAFLCIVGFIISNAKKK